MRPSFSYTFLILQFLLSFSHANWTRTGDPGGGFVFSLAQKDSILFAGTARGVFCSMDRGEKWALVDSGLPDSISVYSILSRESGIFIATDVSPNGVFRSTNSGQNWEAADSGLPETPNYCFAQIGNNLFVGTYDYVFRSTDNGVRWNQLSIDMLREDVQSLAFLGTILFAGTGFGGIARSTNQGASWTSVDSGLGSAYVTSLAVKNDGVFAGTAGGVFYSSDSGAYWTKADSGIPEGTYINTLATAGDFVFAGTAAGVFVSSNSGKQWSNFNSGLPENTQAQSFLASAADLFCGTNNSGVWKAPLTNVAIRKEKYFHNPCDNQPLQLSVQMRPSPYFSFSLHFAQRISISLFNLTGKKITTMASGNFSAGTHRISLNIGIVPGCYSIQLLTETGTSIERVPIIR
jgi:photosystem II stability/assembly factor-like uncharacterized protein